MSDKGLKNDRKIFVRSVVDASPDVSPNMSLSVCQLNVFLYINALTIDVYLSGQGVKTK